MKKIILTLLIAVFTAGLFSQSFRADKRHDLGEMPHYSGQQLTKANQLLGSWGFWKQNANDYLSQALADGWRYAGGDSKGQTFQAKNIYCLTSAGCNGGELIFASSWSYYYNGVFGGNPPAGDAEDLDNWFISPAISIPATGLCAVEWADWSFTNMHGDQYKIMVSTTGDDPSNFTQTLADVTVVDGGSSHFATLDAFAGQTIRLAFWHYSGPTHSDGGAVFCDYMEVYKINDPTLFVNTNYMRFYKGRVGEIMENSANVIGVQLSSNITATVTSPALYQISSDGSNFGTQATFPSTGGNLYVRFSPNEIGEFTGDSIIFSSTGVAPQRTILTGSATDCRYIETPYLESFEEDAVDIENNSVWCWDLFNGNPDNSNSVSIGGYSDGGNFIAFSSQGFVDGTNGAEDYAQYAISPYLNTAPTQGILSLVDFTVGFTYRAYDYNAYQVSEYFKVGYSTTNKELSSFTWLDEVEVNEAGNLNYLDTLPSADVKYVAIKYYNDWGFRLFVSNFVVTPHYVDYTGVKDIVEAPISIYPNPAKEVINIKNGTGEVILVNVSGSVVYKGDSKQSIDVSKFAAGTYFVKIGDITKTVSIVR